MRWLLVLVVACSKEAPPTPQVAPPPKPSPPVDAAPVLDPCTIASDKVVAALAKQGDTGLRDTWIKACRESPEDPRVTCMIAAENDAAIQSCLKPAPQGEPLDQLDVSVEELRTLFFVRETFGNKNVPLTPAKPCCRFADKKCPPDKSPPWELAEMAKVDFSKPRAFQYRFESTPTKAILEAVGDPDCNGNVVTYRRELESRDGVMHITVIDPPTKRP
jgi:hypothetical protein